MLQSVVQIPKATALRDLHECMVFFYLATTGGRGEVLIIFASPTFIVLPTSNAIVDNPKIIHNRHKLLHDKPHQNVILEERRTKHGL